MTFDGFTALSVAGERTSIFVRMGGSGPPVLLLHGFPQTHLMWREVAAALARDFTVVCPDLPGYGRSGCPPTTADHGPYSKRAMAGELVRMMNRLGFGSFALAGHDRGGRVAYRMALDHPAAVRHLAVLDIVPTGDAWDRADARFAVGYWPWSLLAQPEPLPERLVAAAPDAIVAAALDGWGSAPSVFGPDVRAAYVAALSDPAHVHAVCEEYRAAAGIDRDHDAADRDAGRRITCPVLVLWGEGGPLDTWYAGAGGPVGIWREWAADAAGHAIKGGHFFPEEQPAATAGRLLPFFTAGPGGYTAGPGGPAETS